MKERGGGNTSRSDSLTALLCCCHCLLYRMLPGAKAVVYAAVVRVRQIGREIGDASSWHPAQVSPLAPSLLKLYVDPLCLPRILSVLQEVALNTPGIQLLY